MALSKYNTEQSDEANTGGGLEVYLTATESFAGVQNEWYSPETNVALTGALQILFDYVGGSIVYTGDIDRQFLFIGTESILTTGGIGVTLEFALGKNGVVDDKSTQQTESLLSGAPKEITSQKVFTLSNGDSLDFFVRQISSGGNQQINLTKGVWTVIKIMQ